MSNGSLTVAELNDRMRPMFQATADKMAHDIINARQDYLYLFGEVVAPTLWQRLSFPIRWRWGRLADAWLVLTGKRDAI